MTAQTSTRTRTRSSSNALHYSHSKHSNNSLAHHASPVIPPSRSASASIATSSSSAMGMSLASRYAHNLKVLRRRDPSIVSIFDQFSHVCVYHHNGERWEKQGYEGSMFLYERDEYPPYGFYILNRMGMDDYVQRLYPEDTIGAHGSYLMLRSWPEWSKNRVRLANAKIGPGKKDKFDPHYKWDGDMDNVPEEEKGNSQTIGLWMFATDAREPMNDVILKLHTYIKDNVPYPEQFKYGPDKPPPLRTTTTTVTATPGRTPSAASTATTSSTTSSPYTSASGVPSTHSRTQSYTNNGSATNKANGKRNGKTQHANPPGQETPKAPAIPLSSPAFGVTGSNSDLDKLFAKLTSGSSKAAGTTNAGPSLSSDSGSSSLMATLLGGAATTAGQTLTSGDGSTSMSASAATGGGTTAGISTNKMTVESLFAALSGGGAADPKIQPPGAGQKKSLHSPTSSLSFNQGIDVSDQPRKRREKGKAKEAKSVPMTGNGSMGTGTGTSGIALLNDIFASAMDGRNGLTKSPPEIEPTKHSGGHDVGRAREQAQPEPIEVHSPIPTSSLRLPSILTLTQEVVDQLLEGGTGINEVMRRREEEGLGLEKDSGLGLGLGFEAEEREREIGTGQKQKREEAIMQYNGAKEEAESVRTGLMALMGMGARAGGSGGLEVPDGGEAGDVTPRVGGGSALNDGQASSSGPVFPPSASDLWQRGYQVQFEGDGEGEEEDDGILELDFSDTLALSDMGVFETKEREQTLQRAASRAASRSATPAVGSGIGVGVGAPAVGKARAGSNATRVAVNGIAEANGSPGVTTTLSAVVVDLAGASSVTKKPTRRRSAKGKDLAELGNNDSAPEEEIEFAMLGPASPSPRPSPVDSPLSREHMAKINSAGMQDIGTRETMRESLLDALFTSASAGVSKTMMPVIHHKDDLVGEVVRLVQNDGGFVDELWRGWVRRRGQGL